MDEWRGAVNWPVDADWRCETCGADADLLRWGFIHGICRCEQCHTRYALREEGTRLIRPKSLLKEHYKAACRVGWQMFHCPMGEWNDQMWQQVEAKIGHRLLAEPGESMVGVALAAMVLFLFLLTVCLVAGAFYPGP